MTSPILAADSIGKTFGTRRVLTSASLRAAAGEVTLVVGRNGAGKSTLLQIAAGWQAPDHGTIHFGGQSFMRPRLHQLARLGLFFLPDREILAPGHTVRYHLELATERFPGVSLDDVVANLHLASLLDRYPRTLSGGERRRAEVALALARGPRCLIADEPLRGIDPRDAEILLECFRGLARTGCAVIISGHEVTTLFAATDQVVWVIAGTSYMLGAPATAAANEWFAREYSGPGTGIRSWLK